MIGSEDIAYIAGLFDGEGSIHFKRGPEKKKKHRGKDRDWETIKPAVVKTISVL